MRVVIAVVLASLVAVLTHARPAPPPAPDLDRARTEYAAAETAMAASQWNEATNHYANAYRASRDPALLYKIGVARQKAGDCLNATRLFAIYLQLGKPADDFVSLTRDRIRQCAGDPDKHPGPPPADPVAGWGTTPAIVTPGSATDVGPGSAGSAAGSGSAVDSGAAGSAAGSADPGTDITDPSAGAGSAAPLPPPPLVPRHRAAWLLVGGGIAAATIGAVLAYSANASERDLEDLYVGLGGVPPTFNDSTRARYDDLVKEGERYQTLSWIGFGAAAVLGGIAAYRFATDETPPARVQVTPTASPAGAGVSATVRF